MANTYTKKKTLIINGRKRVIYSKKKSRKEYIKSKGRMLNLKTYLKNKKTKKGGDSTPKKTTSTQNAQIIEKALLMQKKREEKEKEKEKEGSYNSDSPLRPPTTMFGPPPSGGRSSVGRQSVINRNAARRSLDAARKTQVAQRAAEPGSYNRLAVRENNNRARLSDYRPSTRKTSTFIRRH